MSKNHFILAFIGILIILLAGNNLMPVTDNVESNYALTAKEMVLSGDWISPQIYGNYWFDKPVMFYWLTALSYKIFGFTDFASRLMPGIFGGLSVLMAGFAGRKLYSKQSGLYSMLILSSFLLFFVLSKLIITDAVLFLFFNATLLFFYLGFSTTEKNYYYVMYAAAGLATLTKGPVGFLLPGLIIVLFLIFTKGWHELTRAKLFSGTLVFLLVTVPWYYIMYKLHGTAFLNVFLGVHNILRATVSEHPRDNVWYYYTVLLLLMAFPWIGFLPAALKDACRKNGHWLLPADRELFLIISMVTVFVFFQNMATKYPTYTYPLLFPLALLLAGWWDRQTEHSLSRTPLIFSTVFYVFLAAVSLLYEPKNITLKHTWLLAIIIIVGLAWQWYSRRQKHNLLVALSLSSMLFYLALTFVIIIPITQIRSAYDLSQKMTTQILLTRPWLSYGDYPPSLVYYSDHKLSRILPDEQVDQYRHQNKFSWNNKNVMPFISHNELTQLQKPVVIVNDKYFTEFKNDLGQDKTWNKLFTLPGWEIWEKP